jgi:hypothetical protein
MRNHFKVSAILVVALFASTVAVVAQTGEFASPVPGSVVHQGYELQDWWQNARNRARLDPPVGVVPEQKPQAESNLAKPKKRHEK